MSKEKTKRNKKIYKARKSGDSYRDIAKDFDLDVKTVWDIVQREAKKREK